MTLRLRNFTNDEKKAVFKQLASESEYAPHKLAKKLNISPRQLQRYFANTTDKTPYEWLHDIRMERAYRALLLAESVKEVAYDLHYKQVSHFSRDFKNYFGHSPSEIMNGRLLPINKPAEPDSEEKHTYTIKGSIALSSAFQFKLKALGFGVEEQQSSYDSVSKAT